MAEAGEKLQGAEHDPNYFLFWCVGCEMPHAVSVNGGKNSVGAGWQWNGDKRKPTFSPSLLISYPSGSERANFVCHSFVRDGKMEFLSDCTHQFKGQTVEIPDWENVWS